MKIAAMLLGSVALGVVVGFGGVYWTFTHTADTTHPL
jgi:hypothetical protein